LSPRIHEELGVAGWAVLGTLAAVYLFRLFTPAWPYAGLAVLPKLYVADLALYLYIVVRKLDGLVLACASRHAFLGRAARMGVLPAAWHRIGHGVEIYSLSCARAARDEPPDKRPNHVLLVAVPEEMFFRGMLQNLLETRLGPQGALVLAAVLFGLAHFNKGASFNCDTLCWRRLPAFSMVERGGCGGKCWRRRSRTRRLDVVWSLWFK